jgi:hypothetical protein
MRLKKNDNLYKILFLKKPAGLIKGKVPTFYKFYFRCQSLNETIILDAKVQIAVHEILCYHVMLFGFFPFKSNGNCADFAIDSVHLLESYACTSMILQYLLVILNRARSLGTYVYSIGDVYSYHLMYILILKAGDQRALMGVEGQPPPLFTSRDFVRQK